MAFLLVLAFLAGLTAVSGIVDIKRAETYRYASVDDNGDNADGPFEIFISDLDDWPLFEGEYDVTSILEGSPVGSIVTSLTTTAEEPVECLLADDTETFELVPLTDGYHLRTTKALDREANSYYIVYAVCSTDDSPPVRVMKVLRVSILDINDNTPVFTQDYFEVSIPEDSPVNSEVISVRANDYDSDDIWELTYAIPDDQGLVRIKGDQGTVYTASLLDREQMDSFSFHVVATDMGDPPRSSSCTVNVTITDVNDARPVFSVDPFYFVVDRSHGVGAEVGLISAVDYDAPPNNAFVFEPFPSYAKFAIDANTGRITVKEDLGQQSRTLYHLTVQARDVQPPALTSSADVFVFVVG